MASLDAPDHPLITALRSAFDPLIELGNIDIVRLHDNEVEIQADEWTLHLEGWPLTVAWIALDEDPASQSARIAAIDAALGARDIAAIRDVNARLAGELANSLQESGDDLSVVLAGALVESDDDDEPLIVSSEVDG